MLNEQLEQALNNFASEVVNQAKQNLARDGKNVTGDLANSLGYSLTINPNSFTLNIMMEQYGIYQDQGVDGIEVKQNRPFTFRKTPRVKSPTMMEGLTKWVKNKGIQFRGKNGRFLTYNQTAFMLRNSIRRKGIKPSLFFTKPFENAFDKLPDEIVEAFALDVENFMESITNNFPDK